MHSKRVVRSRSGLVGRSFAFHAGDVQVRLRRERGAGRIPHLAVFRAAIRRSLGRGCG
jgi:hypothetical protein